MSTATKADYDKLMADRPEKMDEAESGYRVGEGNSNSPHCSGCIHLYQRKLDHYAVCEIVRPVKGDEEIGLDAVCDFWTKDGEKFPLL